VGEALVPLGVRLVQLRIKDSRRRGARRDSRGARLLRSGRHAAHRNDHWQLALRRAAISAPSGRAIWMGGCDALRRAGVRLGVSTHDEASSRAHSPCNPTTCARSDLSDAAEGHALAPQGLERITQWKRRIGAIPLVAVVG